MEREREREGLFRDLGMSTAYPELELKKAIKLQKYEKAAEIQKRLDALESDADGKETT